MSMYKIYSSSFYSRKDVAWSFELWREQDEAPASVMTSRNPSDAALLIEWLETSKADVICGSAATLKLVSPGDRTFIDLYTDRPDGIRLKVFRDGVLYWEGFLDPETYEEPYSENDDYDVTLTFADFGILDRLKYNLSGMKSLSEILTDALSRAGFTGTVDTSFVSTRMGEAPISLAGIYARSDNFYDEDGEPMTLRDVVEGILRPFALRLVQRAGKIWLYDLNGLHFGATQEQIQWASEDQNLAADLIYNNVTINLSVYDDETFSKKFEYAGEVDESNIEFDYFPNSNQDKGYHSFRVNLDLLDFDNIDSLSFTLFENRESEQVSLLQSGLQFFKILPIQGGQECEGVAVMFYVGIHERHEFAADWEHDSTLVKRHGYLPGGQSDGLASGTELFRLHSAYLNMCSGNYSLRLQMKILMDVRYNPFTDLEDNEKTASKKLFQTRRVYVPVKVELVSESGAILYHYSNRRARTTDYSFVGVARWLYEGEWISGAATYDDCELAFDQDTDKWNDSNVFQAGWLGNRQTIPMAYKRGAALKNSDHGQYMPLPPVAGKLRITVCAGMRRSEKDSTPLGDSYEWKNAHDLLRWILFTVPEVALVNKDGTYSEVKSEDIEYRGLLNPNAKEDLELEEICGTSEAAPPTARCLLYTSSGERVESLTRAGRTAHPEQLLIGTLFSQYAERKIKLSGTANSGSGALAKYTDVAMPGKVFMMVAEELDAIEDESNVTVTEFSEDRYDEE